MSIRLPGSLPDMRRHLWATAALLALAACSSPSHDTSAPGVASLASEPPPAKVAAKTPAKTGARPQLRLDTSDEERNRLFTAYDDCLVGHGVKVVLDQPGPVGARRLDDSGEPKAAYTACANRLPLQPPELDEDLNPKFAEQWNDNVRCLRKHGFKVHVTEPGSWTYDSSDVVTPADGDQIEKDCMREAFGAGS